MSHREWGVDETVDRLVAEKAIPPLIAVGIDHAGQDRPREYLPYKDYAGNPRMAEPAGKRFPDFLTDEVMPLVAARYRVLAGHDNTGIGGSSYGGVAALYALLAKPNVFGYGLIESPSIFVGMGQLVRDTGPLVALPVRVFIGLGGRESGSARVTERMTALIRIVEANFRAAGYDDTNFRFEFDPEAAHNEDAWAKRLPAALTFLFGAWREPAATRTTPEARSARRPQTRGPSRRPSSAAAQRREGQRACVGGRHVGRAALEKSREPWLRRVAEVAVGAEQILERLQQRVVVERRLRDDSGRQER